MIFNPWWRVTKIISPRCPPITIVPVHVAAVTKLLLLLLLSLMIERELFHLWAMINTPTADETGSIRKEFIQHDLIHSPAKEQLGEGRAWTPNIIATTIVVAVPAYITGTCIHVRTVGFTETGSATNLSPPSAPKKYSTTPGLQVACGFSLRKKIFWRVVITVQVVQL